VILTAAVPARTSAAIAAVAEIISMTSASIQSTLLSNRPCYQPTEIPNWKARPSFRVFVMCQIPACPDARLGELGRVQEAHSARNVIVCRS
jgi:hypothetical protein